MAWLNRCLHILLKPSSREKGFVSLLLIGALAVGTLLCAGYSSDFVPKLLKFGDYARDAAAGDPNTDRKALEEVLKAGKEIVAPSKPWTSPFDLNAWIEWLFYSRVIDLVEKNVNTPTPNPGGRGRPGQTGACSLSVEPAQVVPGEYVTVTVIVPIIFKSKIAGITGSAGVAGFSIPPTGGSTPVLIPSGICEQTLPISCEAYGNEGTVFSGSTSVRVDFSGLPDFDDDGIVDRCDPDDDNDGSLDDDDCAPKDPERFPGNQEICEDGIDQDCDDEDKPCETPSCDPPACCPEYPINCGDYCIPAGNICCPGGYCPDGTTCCGDYCCEAGTFCCGGRNCCPDGAVCCSDGNCCPAGDHCCLDHCCPDGKACCGNGCCPAGWFCCPDQLGCCPVGTTCTEDGHCK